LLVIHLYVVVNNLLLVLTAFDQIPALSTAVIQFPISSGGYPIFYCKDMVAGKTCQNIVL